MGHKYVYMFSEGDASMRNLLGGKGSNLAEMTKLGLPVPQGFIVTTEACTWYNANNKVLSDEMKQQIVELSVLLASRIIKVNMDREMHDRLFDEAMAEWRES